MRILMLNPPFTHKFSRSMRWQVTSKGGTIYYPIWLAYATGVLENAGYNVKLIDAAADVMSLVKLLKHVQHFKPEMIVSDTSTPSINNDIKVAEKIKEVAPDVKLVLVGPHASARPEQTLKMSDSIDLLARREYDYTLKEVAEVLEGKRNFKDVLGISWKENGKIMHNDNRGYIEDLDSLPFVTSVYKRHLDISNYFILLNLYPFVQIMSGRGCNYYCTFCHWPYAFSGRPYRRRSVNNIIQELEFVKKELPKVEEIMIEDDTFTIDKKRVSNFCDALIERNLNMTWATNARADLRYPLLRKMRKAGCRLLVVGYESGSQEILNNVKKGINVRMMKRFTEDCKKAGIMIHGCFIIGLPGETKDTIRQTVRLMKELNPDVVQVAIAFPLPNTPFHDWCEKNGYLISSDYGDWVTEDGIMDCVVDYPWLTKEEITRVVDEALVSYYFRPGFLKMAIKQMFRDRREATRIFHAGKIFIRYLTSRYLLGSH